MQTGYLCGRVEMLKKLGKYEIVRELGKGGMGVVYQAKDARLGRKVALKTMSPELASNEDLLQRFYREAQSAGRLHHSNIVTIYDIDEVDGIPFIAMEYLEGEDLKKIIDEGRDLTLFKRLEIIVQASRGINYAHEHGVIHRDIKPGNIMVLEDGLVKLVDFGIARVGESTMTRTGMVMGSPMYMSPEQVKGRTVDNRSDIFSLGIVLYELLTGQTPFPGNETPTILYKIVNEDPEPIHLKFPDCPPELQQIISKSLSKELKDRFQSAEELAFELEHLLTSLQGDMVITYLQEGQKHLADSNFNLARGSLQKVLEIDSRHSMAKELLAKVDEQIQNKQRSKRIRVLLSQAGEALDNEEFADAVSLAEEILELDKQHEEALHIREEATSQLEQQKKIAESLEKAQSLVSKSEYKKAKGVLDTLLNLDAANTAALKLKNWVEKEIETQERLQQVQTLVQQARGSLSKHKYSEAIEVLQEAQEIDPGNYEAQTLLDQATAAQKREEERQLVEQKIQEIQDVLGRDDFQEAIRLLEETLEEYPAHSKLKRLHKQTVQLYELQEKSQFIEEQVQLIRKQIQTKELDQANQSLSEALQKYPGETRLTSLLQTILDSKEEERIENLRREALSEAEELIEDEDYPAAVTVLEECTQKHGSSREIRDLLRSARKQAKEQKEDFRLKQVTREAQEFIRDGMFDQAIRLLQKQPQADKSKEMQELLASAREEQKNSETKRKELISQAEKFLASENFDKALSLFENAPKHLFKNAEFSDTYARCMEAQKAQREIETTTNNVERFLSSGDVKQAEDLLAATLKKSPGNSLLLALQEKIGKEKAHTLRATWSKRVSDAQVAAGRRKFADAAKLLQGFPEQEPELSDLAKEVRLLREKIASQSKPEPETTPVDAGATVMYSSSYPETSQPAPPSPAPPSPPQQQPAEPSTPAPPARPAPSPAPAPPMPTHDIPALFQQPAEEPRSKRLWMIVAVVIAALALGIFALRFLPTGGGAAEGFLQLTSVPWGEVVSIKAGDGSPVQATGATPLFLSLPAGEYTIELKNGDTVEAFTVEVVAGETKVKHHLFSHVDVDKIVDELMSKY